MSAVRTLFAPSSLVSWLDARGTLFAAATFGILVAILYGDALAGWWVHDDLLILKQAILHRPAEYFFVPRVWQELYSVSFTPWLTLSFDLDFSLFGPRPEAFYAHQLVSTWFAITAFYLVLAQWVSRSLALTGGVLLLVSAPVAVAAHWLSIRQYLEGLGFALISAYFWVLALRGGRIFPKWASAAFYLLAMLAKEVYVPLSGLLLLLPHKGWQARLRASWLLLLMLAIYLPWRFQMLDGKIGGYGNFDFVSPWYKAPLLIAATAVGLPVVSFLKLFGTTLLALPFAAAIGFAVAGLLRPASFAALRSIFLWLLLAAAPLLPVLGYLLFFPSFAEQYRLLLVPAAMLLIGATLGAARRAGCGMETAPALLMACALGLGLQANFILKSWQEPELQRREGEFLLEKPNEKYALAVHESNQEYLYRGIAWQRAWSQKGEVPASFYRGYFGLDGEPASSFSGLNIQAYDPACRCFRNVKAKALAQRQAVLDRVSPNPLNVDVKWGHGILRWTLGPYAKGSYFLLAGQNSGWYSTRKDVGAEGNLAYLLQGFMRAGYESPEGWVTLSPEFHVDLTGQGQFVWQRAPQPLSGLVK